MSGRRSFSKLKGKYASTSATSISIRFNKLDEELEEVSYQTKESTSTVSSQPSSPPKLVEDVKNRLETPSAPESTELLLSSSEKTENGRENKNIEATESSCLESIVQETCNPDPSPRSSPQKSKQNTREPSPIRDSVKDYLSKFKRRTSSLDSGSSTEESDMWPFLKDLKGRIAKNLEDRISKDVVKDVVTDEELIVPESTSSIESRKDFDNTIPIKSDSEIAPTELVSPDSSSEGHLSPSMEATEFMDDHYLLGNHAIEMQTSKNVLTSKSSKNPMFFNASTTGNQFALSVKTAKTPAKPEFSMTLSSLMSSRGQSTEEEDKTELSESDKDLKDSVADMADEKSSKNAFLNSESSLKAGKPFFSKLHVQLKNLYYSTRFSWNSTTLAIFIAIFACLVIPIPSWFSGFLIGVIISSTSIYWLLKPGPKKEALSLPDFSKLPPLTSNIPETDEEAVIYKGWMNELPFEYNPNTYHVNCTHSVYVRLDGSYLRVSHPKINIPRRAMFNEPRHELAFVRQRHYDITGATLELLPEELPKKRLWSKKYPICLTISNPKQAILSDVAKEPSMGDTYGSTKTPNTRESSPIKKFIPKINENNEIVLFLFARTDREKDEWYRRFEKASKIKMLKSHSPSSSPNIAAMESGSMENKRAVSLDLGTLHLSSSFGNIHSIEDQDLEDDEAFAEIKVDKQFKFEFYMAQLLSSLPSESMRSSSLKSLSMLIDRKDSLDTKPLKSSGQNSSAQNLLWLNTLIGRVFFDFLTEENWSSAVAEKIQKKLSKIKLPHFIEELKITDINLGTALPKIHRASDPVIDHRGLWVDMDVSYNGSFQMTLETKLNLLRLKKQQYGAFTFPIVPKEKEMEILKPHIYNSEDEDSAESSSDEDMPMPETIENPIAEESGPSSPTSAGASTSKKLLRLVDKIAQSSYFQQATKNKYIKRAMEEVSNTPLVLTVEIHWLTGTLAFNIPPMPSDRLWYGFRKNPSLSIVARPKLGGHVVTITHITEWIEKKLVSEFQKILVMPNMDDLIIPIMQHGLDSTKT